MDEQRKHDNRKVEKNRKPVLVGSNGRGLLGCCAALIERLDICSLSSVYRPHELQKLNKSNKGRWNWERGRDRRWRRLTCRKTPDPPWTCWTVLGGSRSAAAWRPREVRRCRSMEKEEGRPSPPGGRGEGGREDAGAWRWTPPPRGEWVEGGRGSVECGPRVRGARFIRSRFFIGLAERPA